MDAFKFMDCAILHMLRNFRDAGAQITRDAATDLLLINGEGASEEHVCARVGGLGIDRLPDSIQVHRFTHRDEPGFG